MSDQSIGGERFTSAEAGHGRQRAGRVCAERGCSTVLSIYNESEYCAVHHLVETPRLRGRKIA